MPEQGGTRDPSAPGASPDEQGWHTRTGLAMHEVEDLLDWLERTGCACREVQVDAAGLTVRWRYDAPHSPKRP